MEGRGEAQFHVEPMIASHLVTILDRANASFEGAPRVFGRK
jgi:hypothetical protein